MAFTSAERKEAISAFVFISPFLVWLIVLMAGPIIAAFGLSLFQWDGLFIPPKFIGLNNYVQMVHDTLFWKALGNTFYFTVLSVPIGMALSIIVALLMNQKVKGIGFFRTVFYLPSVMGASVAVAMLWKWIFDADHGLMNYFISVFTGIPIKDCPGWLASEIWSKPALIIQSFWGVGAGMIIYLAGLQGIPITLYEAADIDGANKWQQFWTVTLPGLSPVIFFQLIIGVVTSFQIFNQVFIMTNGLGGPANSTLVMVLYIYKKAFDYYQMGYASALACVLFLVIMAVTWVQFKYSKWVYYEGELRK